MKNHLNSFSIVSFAVSYGFQELIYRLFYFLSEDLTDGCGVSPYKKHIFSAI